MLRVPARSRHSGGVLRSRRSRRTTTATTLMALERREYPVGKPCWSIHSNPIRGGSTKFMAMCGNGRKTVGTTTTLERLRMGRRGRPGGCSDRVIRGGAWYFYPWLLRAAFRLWNSTDSRENVVGFRLGRTLTP